MISSLPNVLLQEITHTTLSGFDIRNNRTADATTRRMKINFHSPEVTL
jgi:hypothetical protein